MSDEALQVGDYVEVLPVDMCGCITAIEGDNYTVRIHALDERSWGHGCLRFISRKAKAYEVLRANSSDVSVPREPMEPNEEMIAAGVAAFLKDMRDRRLLKWLFAEQNNGAIGYVDGPIDLDAQIECASESVRKTYKAMLSASPQAKGDKS